MTATKSFRYPRVSVLVLNWNNPGDTIECLQSLRGVTYPNFTVVAIDNGSEDDSLAQLKKFQAANDDYGLVILENGKNLGYAGGNNAGIRYALDSRADYIWVLNNDTSVDPNVLNELVKEAEREPDIGMLAPAILFYDQPRLIWFGGTSDRSWRRMDKGFTDTCAYFKKRLTKDMVAEDVSFITGAAMLIRAADVRKVKGFDERFFLYFEDTDLSLRFRKAGKRLRWVPRARVWHKVSATSKRALGSPGLHYYHSRNILLLSTKHGPFWMGFYRPLWSLYTLAKQVLKIALGRNRDVSKAIAEGILDYYRRRLGKRGAH
ncbi:MAG: glycosyltransferase family 2 protein [Candidatus Spechtbacterales bacterium]